MSKKNIKFPGYIILASLLKLWKSQNTKCTCIMDRNLLLCSNTTCNLFICLKYPPPPPSQLIKLSLGPLLEKLSRSAYVFVTTGVS